MLGVRGDLNQLIFWLISLLSYYHALFWWKSSKRVNHGYQFQTVQIARRFRDYCLWLDECILVHINSSQEEACLCHLLLNDCLIFWLLLWRFIYFLRLHVLILLLINIWTDAFLMRMIKHLESVHVDRELIGRLRLCGWPMLMIRTAAFFPRSHG